MFFFIGSGKTTSLVNLLCDPRGFKGLYDKIIIFSPTFKSQFESLWSRISSEGVTVFEELSDVALRHIYDTQYADPTVKTLLISDDMDEQWRRSCDPQLVSKIATNSRHISLSLIFLSQRSVMLPPSIRSQSDCLCVWNCSSYLELTNIHKEYSTLPKKEFLEIFSRVTSQPYHYLAICTVGGKLKMYDSFQIEVQ